MTKNLNRYKKIQKESFKKLKEDIKSGKQNSDHIEYIFPMIHGVNYETNKEYNFSNIIEAREYLNNKLLVKNVIDICELILKSKKDIKEILDKTNTEKFLSSLTLFDYITNPKIDSFLLYRNYDKKIITKVFTNKKEFEIFRKIIKKFYNNETDKTTINIIESEILEYSKKEETLKNIEKEYLTIAEDLLIKHSEICPIVTTEKSKIKKFYKNLSDKEYLIFCKFNIEANEIKEAKKYKHAIKEKIAVFTILSILLLSGSILLSMEETISYNEDYINVIDKSSLAKFEDQIDSENNTKEASEEEIVEENEETQEEQPELVEIIETKPEPIVTSYSYVEPTGIGNVDLVNIASSQVGNVGGAPYWSWYGFTSRVEWCACFVSWVANQAGISTDVIPKFSRVREGASWFISHNLFRDRNYIPRSGDLIFFDYNYDGATDHVGIVETVSNGRVFTIEGNSLNDDCSKHSYVIGDGTIYGYGTPNY